jgi:PUB domain
VLLRILSNILEAPTEVKFRRLRLANPKINAAVVQVICPLTCLCVCNHLPTDSWHSIRISSIPKAQAAVV